MATPSPFHARDYKSGDKQLSATNLNAHQEETQRLGRISGAGGITVQSNGAGIIIGWQRGIKLRYGIITANGTGVNDTAHAVLETFPSGFGDFDELTGGIDGDVTSTPMQNPMYEINGEIVPVGTNVIFWPGASRVESGQLVQEWEFQVGGGGPTATYGYQQTGINVILGAPRIFVVRASADTTINSGTDTDITGATISIDLDQDSIGTVDAFFDYDSVVTGTFEGKLSIGGAIQTGVATFYNFTTTQRCSVGMHWDFNLAKGTYVFKLLGARVSALGSAIAHATNTSMKILVYENVRESECTDFVCDIVEDNGYCVKIRKSIRGRFVVDDELCETGCDG